MKEIWEGEWKMISSFFMLILRNLWDSKCGGLYYATGYTWIKLNKIPI